MNYKQFCEVAKQVRQQVVESVLKILLDKVEEGKLKKEGAAKMMNSWINMVNARMSTSENSPTANTADHLKPKYVVRDSKDVLIVDKYVWSSMTKEKRDVELGKLFGATTMNTNRSNYGVDISTMTFGEIAALWIGNIPLIVNAGKHLNGQGELKVAKESKAGMKRKFAYVKGNHVLDALQVSADKTYARWLNKLIGKSGELLNKYKLDENRPTQFRVWHKPQKEGKSQSVMVSDDVLVALIDNGKQLKTGGAESIKVGIYSDAATHVTFGCYQVVKSSTFVSGNMLQLVNEAVEEYKKAILFYKPVKDEHMEAGISDVLLAIKAK